MALDPIDVIRRFEPILYFHTAERFFPSDAKRYLERCALWDVNGSPRDSKARWGGTSPRTFPHFPRIPRGKLIAAAGEAPVVPESTDGVPGTFIGDSGAAALHLLDSAAGERFLDLSGWIGGDAVDAASANRYADLDQVAGSYGGGDADLAASRFWYHAEVFSKSRLERLVRTREEINQKRLAALTDPALVCYYLFFPGHDQPIEGCGNEAGQRWASCAGEWGCVAVLLQGDLNQNNYQPVAIGLTARNAGTLDFLGQDRRIGMRVVNWNLVTKVVRPRPNAAAGEHPRIFVARGTHGLYRDQATPPALAFSPDDYSDDSCGEYETVAAANQVGAAAREDREEDERLILAKIIAGAAMGAQGGSFMGPIGALAGAVGGAIAGFGADLIEFGGMAGVAGLQPPPPGPQPPQSEHPPGPGEIGTVIHPRGIDPPDAPVGSRREWPRLGPQNLDDETKLDTVDAAGRATSLWVANAAAPESRPVWLPSEDPTTPSFRGPWGNRVVNDPFNRRVGMRFPEFWFMFINGLGKS